MCDIEKYLPPILQEITEFEQIMGTENIELHDLWTAIKEFEQDQFINDATEQGIKRWESILRILPKGSDDLDLRRFRVLSRLNQQLPYSYKNLEAGLKTLCGNNGYTLSLLQDEYKLVIRVALGNKGKYAEVQQLANKMVPANMVIDISIKYNPYSTVEQHTYKHLSKKTYEQIRSEVIV